MNLGLCRVMRQGFIAQRAQLVTGRNGYRALSSSSPSSGDQSRDWKKWGLGVATLGLGSALAYTILSGEKKKEVRPPPPPPRPIPDLPSKVDYLLIGAGTASFSAFRSIKGRDIRSKILLIGSEDQIPYMRPPLSKEMFYNSDPELKDSMKFEQWNGRQRSLYYEPEAFYTPLNKLEESSKGGISVLKNTWVTTIDSEKQIAYLVDRDGQVGSVEYGKCLLATGSRPKSLPELKNLPLSSVSTFKSFSDFNKIDDLIQKGKVSSIAVIGGGLLGTELSCAFGARSKVIDKNFTVTQIVPEEGNMGLVLPKYLSKWMTDKVKSEGVCVKTQCSVKSAETNEDKVILKLSNGTELKVDHVIVSVGSEPNVQLAESAQLETAQGGLKVNSEFKAKKNIWAAGDVASFEDPLLGQRRLEHHDHAVTSGRIAGENMAGGSLKYSKQSMFWSDLGPDIGFEAVGLVDSKLPTHSVFLSKSPDASKDDFDRGVVFYLQDGIIVGVLLWNIFDQIGLARRVIREKRKFEDITEVAKLFRLVDSRLDAHELGNKTEVESDATKAETEAHQSETKTEVESDATNSDGKLETHEIYIKAKVENEGVEPKSSNEDAILRKDSEKLSQAELVGESSSKSSNASETT